MQIESRIKELGGAVSDNVSKKTSYVLVGENPGSKVRKAQQLGTPIINEDEFEQLVEGNSRPANRAGPWLRYTRPECELRL